MYQAWEMNLWGSTVGTQEEEGEKQRDSQTWENQLEHPGWQATSATT